MSRFIRTLTMLFLLPYLDLSAQASFISTGSGDWDDCVTWGFGAGCTPVIGSTYPDLGDAVTISDGDVVYITDDNGNRPRDFGVGSGVNGRNADVFLHQGYILVEGTLEVSAGFMVTDQVDVSGGLSITGDLFTTGIINVRDGASSFSVGDDMVLAGPSETNIGINAPITDDIYFDGTAALLCGSSDTLFLGSAGSAIQEFNGADAPSQACDDITVCINGACSAAGSGTFLLPVELLYFKGRADNGTNTLEWATESEQGNGSFTIKRSHDGHDWKVLTKVEGSGTTEERKVYRAMDDDPLEDMTYYLLTQTDIDGTEHVYEVIVIRTAHTTGTALSVYPNPTHGTVHIPMGSGQDSPLILEVLHPSGRQVARTVLEMEGQRILSTDLRGLGLSDGIYLLRVMGAEGQTVHKVRVE